MLGVLLAAAASFLSGCGADAWYFASTHYGANPGTVGAAYWYKEGDPAYENIW